MPNDVPDWQPALLAQNQPLNMIYGTTQISFKVTPGPIASGVTVSLQAAVGTASTVTVIGGITGTSYGSHVFQPTDPVGTSFQVNIGQDDLAAPNGVTINNPQGASLNVDAMARAAALVGNLPTQPLYVSENATNPAPWQVPLSHYAVHHQFTTTGSITLVAGAAGQQIYHHNYSVYINVATACEFQLLDSGGTVIHYAHNGGVAGKVVELDLRGFRLGVGLDLVFKVTAIAGTADLYISGGITQQ